MLIIVQGTTPKYSSMRRPALDRRRVEVVVLHPAVEDHAELGHLEQRHFGDATGAGIGPNLRQLRVDRRVGVGQALDAPEDSDRSSVSRLMPDCSSSFSLKRTVLKASGRAPSMPEARAAHALDDAAHRHEVLQVFLEIGSGGAWCGAWSACT